MIKYASDVMIARPPGDVWPYLVEREKQALYTDVPMLPLTEGPWRVGSRAVLSFGRGPLGARLTLEITSLDRDRRVAFTTVSHGGIRWEGEYRLDQVGETSTRLSQQGTIRFSGLWRLAEPIVGVEMRRNELAELEGLKKVLETAP